jgi:hypothetical protein
VYFHPVYEHHQHRPGADVIHSVSVLHDFLGPSDDIFQRKENLKMFQNKVPRREHLDLSERE